VEAGVMPWHNEYEEMSAIY